MNNKKNSFISRNTYNLYNAKNYNNLNDNIIDFSKEKDFISYKMNKKQNKKLISKSITTTIKCEYKTTTNNSLKNNKTKDNDTNYIKDEKCSTILRSQSNILNNRPTDSFCIKNTNVSNYEKNNHKYKQNNKKNKGFENFNLNKVCGSSHPIKQINNKNNNLIKKEEKNEINKKENNNNEYKYFKSYTIKYDYQEEENNITIDNNKVKNNKLLVENNQIYNYRLKNNTLLTKNNNEIYNHENNLIKNKEKILLLPKKQELYSKIKKKPQKKHSLSTKNLLIETKNDNENKINIGNNKINQNYNKNNNKINKFILYNDKNIFFKDEENKNDYNINEKLKSLKNHKIKKFFFRNNKYLFDDDDILNKKIRNKKSMIDKKNKININNHYFNNYNNYINSAFNKPNIINENYSNINDKIKTKIFSDKTINFIKKYGNIENNKCVMPANNLSSILINNQKEFMFNTNYLSKLY